MCQVVEIRPLHNKSPAPMEETHSRNARARKKGTALTPKKKNEVVGPPNAPKKNQRPKKQSGEKKVVNQVVRSRRKGSFGESTASTCCTSDSSSDASECAVPQYVKLGRIPVIPNVDKLRYVAMDCEMVGIGENGTASALARVSLVNWDGDVLLDTYVKVSEPVTDLRANVSGISFCHIDGSSSNTMNFDEVAAKVQGIISDKILVGHGLKNDLRVLNITHPWENIRDTAKYEPFMKKDGNNMWIPRKLKELTMEKFGFKIQEEGKPHCSVEDAVAAMQLYQLVSKQWEKVIDYKIKKTREIRSLKKEQEEIKHSTN